MLRLLEKIELYKLQERKIEETLSDLRMKTFQEIQDLENRFNEQETLLQNQLEQKAHLIKKLTLEVFLNKLIIF